MFHQDEINDKELAKVLGAADKDTGYGFKKNPSYSNGYFRYNVFPPSSTTEGRIEDPEPGIQVRAADSVYYIHMTSNEEKLVKLGQTLVSINRF